MTAIAAPLPRIRVARTMPWWLLRGREKVAEDTAVRAIALVNKTTGTADGGATSLAATAASHTAGNLLAVGVIWTNVATQTANVPTDTAGNTYVSTGFKAAHGTTDFVEVFYAKNITGNASNVVTAHWPANASFRRVIVYQYSGCDITAPFTAGEGGTGTVASGTSVTTSSWTTAIADEVLVAFFGSSGTGSGHVAGSGYTLQTTNLGGDSYGEDRIVSATGTYTASLSWTGAQAGWLAAASFAIAGGGGGGAPIGHLASSGVG